MDKEVTHGQMAENTKELMKMIRNTDLVCILGLMEGNMRDIGLMENNMAVVSLYRERIEEKEFGKRERE